MANTSLHIPVLEERKKFKDYRQAIRGDSFNWDKIREWSTIKHIVFHHSVTKPTGNSRKDVDYIAHLHCEPEPKGRGWDGVGYHFIITPDGMVWYVGDISMQRANVAGKNHLVIGICLVGDFTKYLPTDDQILSAHDLANYLIHDVPALTNVKGWESVVGHKELQKTACPGINWKGVPDSVYERIKNRIPYTPQPIPEPVVNWEKRYNDLQVEKQKQSVKFEQEKGAMIEDKDKIMIQLAEQKIDCQRKIKELRINLENAEKENPKIKTLGDYTNKEIVVMLIENIKESIKIWGDKKIEG